MATSIISGKVNDPTGGSLNNIRVTCVLRPRPAFKTSTGAELSSIVATTTSGTGDYSFTLERTADITPANSYYEITEYIPDHKGGPVKHVIQVGSSNTTVLASLVSSPPAPVTAVYLTQTAADARYVQSPGSFGGASDISDSRPNDAAGAGALSTYARSDHTHEREVLSGTAAARAALSGNFLFEGLRFRETDGNDLLYERRAGAWLQVAEHFVVADAAARTAITTPYEGMTVRQADTDRIYTYSGSAWVGPVPIGLTVGGVALTDTNITSANTDTDWPSSATITNPGVPVSIVGHVQGYAADFTAITVHLIKVQISIDGGSSFTAGATSRMVAGQGGANYNSQAYGASHFRTGTPTGNIVIKATGQNSSTTSTMTNGVLTYFVVPT